MLLSDMITDNVGTFTSADVTKENVNAPSAPSKRVWEAMLATTSASNTFFFVSVRKQDGSEKSVQ